MHPFKYFIDYLFMAGLIFFANSSALSSPSSPNQYGQAASQHNQTKSSNGPYFEKIMELGHDFMHSFIDTLRTSKAQRIEYTLQTIDSRWAPPKCQHMPEVELPIHSPLHYRRLNLKIRCNQPKPWSLYLKASIQVFEPVVVAKQAITRGTLLSPQHLQLTEKNISEQYRGFFTDMTALVGSETRYPILAGRVITPHQVSPNLFVKKGDSVAIQLNASGLKITASGVALAGGQIGEQIRVKNLSSERIIDARIVAKGVVKVDL